MKGIQKYSNNVFLPNYLHKATNFVFYLVTKTLQNVFHSLLVFSLINEFVSRAIKECFANQESGARSVVVTNITMPKLGKPSNRAVLLH